MVNLMTKLIVTADIHGSYNSWLTIKNLLKPSDKLVIAGDLFDTKFGNFSNTDFQPDFIKKELKTLEHHFYYVYGNCDTPSFFPGFDTQIQFTVFNKNLFLSHGHQAFNCHKDIDIIIYGHTHIYFLEKKEAQIVMNPGSITCPRNGIDTYGVIEKTGASIIDLKTGNKLITMDF